MAELHPTFDASNQATAERIVDRLVELSGTTIDHYDEGNPGSSREVRVHTPLGNIWVSPTRVWAPGGLAHTDEFEFEPLDNNGRSYLLPTRSKSRSIGQDDAADTELCQNCFISHPVGGSCPFCGDS